MKLKPEKYSGLNRIQTHDLCDTGAVLYQLSYQANWELVTLKVHNIPIDGEEYKWIYERSYIWTVEKDTTDHRSYTNNLSSCEIKASKPNVIFAN